MGMRCDCERCSTLARTVGSVANLFDCFCEQHIFAKYQDLKLNSVKLEPVANAVAMVDPLSIMPSKKVATIAKFIAIIPSRKTPLDSTPIYPQK